MIDVASDGHLQRSSQCLEYSFNLMVLVLSLSTNVQVHACGIAERLEEVQEHLGGNIAHTFAVELRIPYKPGPATEVEGYRTETVVHGQAVTVSFNAALVTQGF